MKKRLKQTLSMLLIGIMLVSLFPGGAWAEEAIQGSTGKNWIQEFGSTLTAKWGQQKMNPLPERAADPLDLTAESQPPATAGQSIQTTAVEGDYEYAVVEGGATITKYLGGGGDMGTGGDVTIPATLGGLPVTKIGDYAFYYRSLTSISLPEGLTSIGEGAFYGCSGLTSISLPESLTIIGDRAFCYCSSLTRISLPKSLTIIGDYAFCYCFSLKSIKIPERCISIGKSAFSCCGSLTSIILPEGLTSIGDGTFFSCGSLMSIILPESLTSIGDYSFSWCNNLMSIILPESLTSIGEDAFYYCSSLKSIRFNSVKTIIIDERLDYYKQETIPATTAIIGYDPSTAKDYATKYGNPFQLISDNPTDPTDPEDDAIIAVSDNEVFIKVRDIDSKEGIVGVTVSLDGQSATTDSGGLATYENPAIGEHALSIKSPGYLDYESSLMVKTGGGIVIYLQKDTGDNKPYLTQVNLKKGSMAASDVRQYEKVFVGVSKESDLIDDDYGQVEMKANLRGQKLKRYILSQNGKAVMESTTGKFDRVAIAEKFAAGSPIYAIVETQDGTCSRAVETKIKIMSASFKWGTEDSSGAINLGKSMGATIPSDLPVLGGTEIDLNMNLIPATVTVTPDRFKIALGPTDMKNMEENWSTFKKTIDDAKDTANRYKNLKKVKEIFGAKAIGMTVTSGWKTDMDVVGYIEGTIVDGQPVVTKGAMLLNASGSYSQQTQYIIGPVPVYLEVGAGLDLKLMGEIARLIPESGEVKLTTELTITPNFELGGGVGIANVVTVGAAGKAELGLMRRFSDDYYKISLTGSMSLKAKALFFEAKKEIAKGTWVIKESYGNQQSVNASETGTGMETFNIYDPNQYSLMPRDYAQNPTTWGGEQPLMSVQSADYTNQTLSVLQTNLFPNAQPKMATIGDQQVMVWIADNTSRSATNRTMLVYSIYNSSTKTWSEPVAVADDSTADFYPQIASDGSSLYVTWQNSKTTFADTVTLTEAAKAGEIAVAKYNPTTKAFDAAVTLTSNDTLDTQPQIAVSGDKAGVVWSSNSANDLFGTTGRNTIQYAELTGTAWTAVQDLVSDQNAITGLAAGYTGTSLSAAFTVDGDNDLNTITDRELFAAKPGQNATRLTNDNALDSNPVFASMNGSDSLFWYHDGNIVYTPAADLGATPATVFAETRQGFGDTFSIVNNPAGKTAVIKTETSNEMTEIHGAIYEKSKNQWSDDIQISNLGSRVQFPNGIFDDSGNFNIAFNRLTIREDLTEQSDLCVVNVVPAYNLTLDNVSYSDDAIIPKTALPVEVDVTNNGQLPVDRITVEVSDGGTINTSSTITESIKPGESKTLNTTINLPETITKKDYTVSIKPATGDEYNLSDNSKTITLGYTDLALAIEKNSVGDTASMTVQVSNLSYVPTNATLKVTEDSPEGKVLLSKDLTNLTKGTNMVEIVELDPKTMTFAGETKQIYVSITATGTEEISTGDNSDFIVINNPTPTVDPGDPTESGLVAFLGKDSQGTYYEYNAAELNTSYLAYQINPGMATAKMYQQFLKSKCSVIGLKDKAKGYMDYNAAATASLKAQMKGEAFDINAYFSGSDAKKLAETIGVVKIVDKDGNVS